MLMNESYRPKMSIIEETGTEDTWGLRVPSSQFFCKFKTVLTNKAYLKKCRSWVKSLRVGPSKPQIKSQMNSYQSTFKDGGRITLVKLLCCSVASPAGRDLIQAMQPHLLLPETLANKSAWLREVLHRSQLNN